MGSPKQLLPFRGKPLVRHAAQTALATSCRPVFVVVGACAKEVCSALDGLDVEIVHNSVWDGGMGSSSRAGVEAATQKQCSAVILSLADQPFVTSRILEGLHTQHETSGMPIIASEYAGTLGVPAFFAESYFPRLLAFQPSEGCKRLLLSEGGAVCRVACPEAELDVDTVEDYRAISSLPS